ncbi:uncharacterized protein C15orf39 homolog [Electrophorus electricus]|uniref:Uncharacterized protein n=1 Tax=Electrophorus electricus TaxID=8005 RepID=A0A4W4G402_ELEEL|nr:uncharacterized protein C15orf39 homolog [Electrophorus electricus]XP_026879278.2 uncharacterized protein C15orf39 homolog [Electrophorus electricus]
MNLKSLRQDIMKSSKHVPSFVDPSAQGNMARLEDPVGNMGPPGLPKADNPPQYSQDKALPFRQTFMPCSLSGKEAVDLHSPWSTSRTCVRNGGSQVVHQSTAEGSVTSQMNYRPEDVAFPMDTGSPAAMEELAAKHKFAYYSRSPIEHSPSAAGVVSPVAFRKPPAECMGLSPPSAETSVGLAVPKPVYRHRPCCTDPKCTVGQNYAVDQGLHRVPPPMFEEDWAAHYSHWAYLHKKEQEALMQQRILPFEPCRERVPLKDVPSESYHGLSPGRLRRASAFTEPGHGSYLSSPAHPFLSSPQEHCQRFQMPPQTHSDLRPVYEPLTQMHCGMPTRVYQDHPHTSKYVDVSRRPFLYCPQNNIEIYRPENSHIIDKQASGQCPVPQTYFNDLPKPYSIIPPGHPAIRNVLDYSAYRMHLNASEAVTRVNPLTERPCPRPALPQVDRPLDFSLRREQSAVSHRDPHGPFGSLGAFHQTQSQAQHRVAAESPASSYPGQGRDSFPASSVCDHIAASRCPGDTSNKKQSLHISDKPANSVPLSKRPREETENICEDDNFLEKVQKLDKRQTDETQAPSSPLMPVINKVFSLAPYKTYLEAAGMLLPAQDPSISELPADSDPPKSKSEAQGMDSKANLSQDDLKTKAVTTPPAVCCDAPEIQSLKVKEEKLEEDEASCPSEIAKSPNPAISHHAAQVKKEPADLESAVCDAECSAVVIKTDIKPEYLTVTPELSEPPKTEPGAGDREETVRTQNTVAKSSDLPNMLPSISPAPLQTLQSTFSLSKIPPQCLKLTSYNIVVPEVLRSPMPPIPEVLQSPAEPKTAISSSRRARHQFMELHQSLCVLVSRCVSQTSRQELRSWLSRLDLVSPPTKTQKVSCLLGSKAREAWLRGDETMAALQKVLSQLEKYVRSRECPFLHVIRAGAVFIPMLVVKEALFPQVQGAYIDQVLQEHRVELRPTTLSEERHLTQLHRQSFSSRLRRLLSLKHLPDMYPDVLNLLYYASVCKFLDSTHSTPTDDVPNITQE